MYKKILNEFSGDKIGDFIVENDVISIIKEGADTVRAPVDDGPGTFYRSLNQYKQETTDWVKQLQNDLGYKVIGYILSDGAMDPEEDYTMDYRDVPAISYGAKKKYKTRLRDVIENLGWRVMKWMGVDDTNVLFAGPPIASGIDAGGRMEDNIRNTSDIAEKSPKFKGGRPRLHVENKVFSPEWWKQNLVEGVTQFYGLSIEELLNTVLNFKGKTLIYFDTETLGFQPKTDYLQLTEIAAIAYSGDTFKEVGKLDYKVNLNKAAKNVMKKGTPERKSWDDHVSPRDKLQTPQDVLKMTRYGSKTAPFVLEAHSLNILFEFINKYKNPILIAHNAPFDLKYLGVRASKYGIKMKKYKSLDTLALNRMFFIPLLKSVEKSDELDLILKSLTKTSKTGRKNVSSTLGNLSKAMKIDTSSWHNALADVEMMVGVLSKMIEFLKKYKNTDIEKLHRAEVEKVAKQRHKKKHKKKRKESIEEGRKLKVLGIYPGRFQPFGRHHYKAYKYMAKLFGKNNTYISTSNKVDTKRSPLNFKEKQQLISKMGVPSNKIILSRLPYLWNKLNPLNLDLENVVLVYAFGVKDKGRITGGSKKSGGKLYFQPYEKNKNNLKPASEHSYYVEVPHISFKIEGKEISGTWMRELLGSSKYEGKREKIFKELFGYFDKRIYKLVTDKFKKIYESVSRDTVFSPEWWKKEMLLEGGAAGHLNHPFDDKDLTFGDLKKIIKLGIGGKLNREDNVTEKMDGQNIMVSWKDGELIAARNKTQLKGWGKNSMTVNQVVSKFKGHAVKSVKDAYVFAIKDLNSAIGSLTEKQKRKIFNDGHNFMNLEIMYAANPNTIDYDISELIFHGALEYDEKGTPIGEVKGSARMLEGMIRQINQNIQKKFKISKPNFLDVPKHQDFGKLKPKFLKQVDKLRSEFGLNDSDTISVYHQSFWKEYIYNASKQHNYKIPDSALLGLTKRWAFFDKSYSVRDMKRDIDNEVFLDWVLSTDKNDHTKIVKSNMRPFEVLFFEVGVEILKGVSGFIAASPDKTVLQIRKDVTKAIKAIKGGGDIKKINRLSVLLDRLNAIGGLKSIVPSEGIVFKYNGKTYKFTGSFAPVNQILSLVTFG